jgi:hypothetical protein
MNEPKSDSAGGPAGYTPQLNRYSELASIAAERAALDNRERIAICNARASELPGHRSPPRSVSTTVKVHSSATNDFGKTTQNAMCLILSLGRHRPTTPPRVPWMRPRGCGHSS